MAGVARTIRLRKKLVKIHTTRRLKKSVDYLREDIARHAKADISTVKFSSDLNGYLMTKVAMRMRPVKVIVEKTADRVNVDLAPELKRKPKAVIAKKAVATSKAQAPAPAKAEPQKQKAAPKQKPAPAPEKVG